MFRMLLVRCLACSAMALAGSESAYAQTRVLGNEWLSPPVGSDSIVRPLLHSDDLPRNFGALHPPKSPVILPVGNYGPTNFLIRPWYVAPYRYYSYYRPWYTFGYYGPTYYRYHYSPSWGYPPLPFHAPPYLSPAGYGPPDYGPPDYSNCYYW